MKIIEMPQYGPMFRFTDANVYWALYTLSEGRRIGRKRLAEESGVGEGSMRRILETLRDKGFVSIKQTGIIITREGQAFLEELPLKVVNVDLGDAVVGSHSQAVLVYGVAKKIENGMQQRDVGIRVGADGCTTVVFRNGVLTIPPDWNLEEQRPSIAKAIRESTDMSEDDALIVGSSSDKNMAMVAALAAAFELI